MSRTSRWSAEERSILLRMVHEGVAEQIIREHFIYYDKYGVQHIMSGNSFAQQLKRAMVEAGEIKQNHKSVQMVYKVTHTGRLVIPDFMNKTGAQINDQYTLKPPRGRARHWRIVPADKNEAH